MVKLRLLFTLTDFGDAALLLPLALAILCWLAWRSWYLASWWSVSVALCIGLTSVSKIYFYGCPPASDMRSPSGHTAFSVLVYGALALIIATPSGGIRRAATLGLGASLIMAIAVSRLVLNIHSLPEIILGFVIGAASVGLFTQKYMCWPQAQVWRLAIAVGLLITLLHGQQLHAEGLLHWITGHLRLYCR